jgi:hypothetical protein
VRAAGLELDIDGKQCSTLSAVWLSGLAGKPQSAKRAIASDWVVAKGALTRPQV